VCSSRFSSAHRWVPPVSWFAIVVSLTPLAAASERDPHADLVFLVDPDLSMDPGVRTTTSIARTLYRYDDALRPWDEDQDAPVGIAGRSLKVLLLDAPLASLALTFGHEVYGHGARAREQGLSPTYQFRLVQPYATLFGQHDVFSGEATFDRQGQEDRDLALVTGGIEADYRAAFWLTHDLVQHGGAHYGDMLLYAAARLSYATTLLGPGGQREPSNDVHNYVDLLQTRFNRWTQKDKDWIESRLSTAYAWNLLDPTLLFALYAVAVNHVVHGQRWTHAPLPTIGDVRFLPWPSVYLSPFGVEHQLDLFLGSDGVVVDTYGRVGSSRLASSAGAGMRVSGLKPTPFLRWGAHVDAWSQPETLTQERNVFDRPQRPGGNVGTEGTFALSPATGFVLGVGYKTRGYLPARPMDSGLHGYAGLRWSPP
jgi:hypothetical protein